MGDFRPINSGQKNGAFKKFEDVGEASASVSRMPSDDIPHTFSKVSRLRTSGRTLAIFGVKRTP